VALRGALSADSTDIRYTTDGSPPSAFSMRYTGPITLNATTTVRAAVFRNSMTIVTSIGVFTKGSRPVVATAFEPGRDMGTAEDPTQARGKAVKGKRSKRTGGGQ
jgi:hypothetical protein